MLLGLHNVSLCIDQSSGIYLLLCVADYRSSVSDSGIGMICNVFPSTLSRLLLALCPNITSSNSLVLSLFYIMVNHYYSYLPILMIN